jgi:hypothetical protein
LCVVEKWAGFAYNSQRKTWETTNFASGRKYIISESRKPDVAFQITEVGSPLPFGFCKHGFNKYGILRCDDDIYNLTEFKFNKDNGRFLYTGYIGSGNDEKDDTPSLASGKCSPF